MKISLVFTSFSDSFRIIREAKLRKFYFLPGIISIFLFMIFLSLGDIISDNLTLLIEKFLNVENYHSIVLFVIKTIVWVCSILFYFLIYKSLLLIILSPILSYVSERVETYLTGKKFEFGLKKNISFIGRGISIGFKSFIKQMIATILIMFLGFIFPINLSIPLLVFIVQAYFTGFSFMDYTLERHELSSSESLKFLKRKRTYATLSGTIFTLLFFIPFIGPFLAPLLTCVAVTKITLELLNEDKEKFEIVKES